MLQAKFGGFVSPLNGIDAHRDRERQGARNFSNDAASYAESHKLGDLMCEMLNGLVVSKPDKPVDFLIDLLSKQTAPRVCIVAPPGFPMESLLETICGQHNMVLVSVAPLVEEARERIIDGMTVAEHEADSKGIPDHIVVKLLTERLVKPDCVEKGWLLNGAPVTRGQAQQLVASGHVPDKVLYLSAPDDTLVKAVAAGEDVLERKKQLVTQLQTYRWEMENVYPVFGHISRTFSLENPTLNQAQTDAVMSFLAELPTDPGLKDIKR